MGRIAVAAALLFLTSCQTVHTTRGGTVGINRPQQMIFSSSTVDAQARSQYAAVVKQANDKGTLNRDRIDVQRVRTIANRLIPHTAVFRDDAPRWAWEVNVLESDQVNAWCMPGGKIAVYTGLIDKLEITDDELAAVIGHEIAHALREHARERMSRAAPAAIGVQVLGAVYGQSVGELSNVFAQAMFVLPNSRGNEQEADRIGVELAARAGFDPRAAVSLWNKMARVSGGKNGAEWLSTHPSHETRVRDLQDYSQRVMPLYDRARRS